MSLPPIPNPLSLGFFSRAFPTLGSSAGSRTTGLNISQSPIESLQEDVVNLTSQGSSNSLGLSYKSEQVAGINNQKQVYKIDLESGKGTIKVVDIDTNEEIREIPGEDAQRLSQTIDDFHVGSFSTEA